MERKEYSYDEFSDSLIVSNKFENNKTERNFEVGDIIFSLTKEGKITSIEIRGASYFLESCNISPDILKNIKSIELNIIPKRGTLFLILKIESIEESHILTKVIPLVVPLLTN